MTTLIARCHACQEETRFPIGETAAAVKQAVAKLTETTRAGKLEPVRNALATMAVDLARALDLESDGRAVATIAKELRATLEALEEGAAGDDSARAAQNRLSTAVGHPPQPQAAHARPPRRGGSRSPR